MSPADSQVYPEPIVGALVLGPGGDLLLVRSHKWGGLLGFPGGHVELGETLHAAVAREVREETGLKVDQVKFLCFQEMVFDDVFWEKRHFIFFDFVCRAASSEVRLNREAQEHIWVSPAEALELDLDPYTRTALYEYNAAQETPG